MNLHEYQAKHLLHNYGIQIPKGFVARDVDEAVNLASKIQTDKKVIKAQIHAGGRGKAGGIQIVNQIKEVKKVSENLLGSRLVTPQTGKEGLLIHEILIEEACEIKDELYIGITLNRQTEKIEVMASTAGGINIEEAVLSNQSELIAEQISVGVGLQPFMARRIAFKLVESEKLVKQLSQILMQLYQLYIENDCTTVEINPLIVTNNNNLIALDAKVAIDDSALFRQKKFASLEDHRMKDNFEIQAEQQGLSYVYLGGNVGCMVNGAGLAMATMDAIYHVGERPANFLDVGGNATKESIIAALNIILKNKEVRIIFVNIFGGIVHCDVIAKGILEAAEQFKLAIPIVVRLEGTKVEKGRSLLENTTFRIYPVSSLKEGINTLSKLLSDNSE